MLSLNDIRSTFLDYFARNGHEVVPSSSLVPRNDPTLMFTAAGMVQFKTLFTGVETRSYRMATTAQKCVRAGGKHNDLDNVGYTARHHTFFEMLGNFSFGDYFKDRAIPLAWGLLTEEFGIDPDRLLVTVYHTDEEAVAIWKKTAGLPDERIIRIATDDNFWSAGPTGPCGPCTEIFYDHGPHIPGGPPGSPDEDGDRFIEIWNLVFMEFEQFADGTRRDLDAKSIDTGMGLERIGALLQGKHDNYDTDLLRALIEASAAATGTDPDGPGNVHHRVIADHLRSTSFLIADGVLPANEGRGYVLRRIMRRAMRHAHQLGAGEPVMHKLVPELVRQMGQAYPELGHGQRMIEDTLHAEETRFRRTLDRGLRMLDEEAARLPEGESLAGETAFKLYDTYGFPLDLTQDALRERGRGVNTEGFDSAMAAQKAKARASWAGSGEQADAAIWFDVAEERGTTEFLGYEHLAAEAEVIALASDGERVKEAAEGADIQLVVNQTPFYAEAGGQVGDTGRIETAEATVEISDTRKVAGLFLHIGRVAKGILRDGDAARTRGRCRPAAENSRESLRYASAERGLAGGARIPCRTARLAERRRAAALRFQSSGGPVAGGTGSDPEPDQPFHPAGRSGRDQDHGPRHGARTGGPGALRGEVRRRGSRGLDGRRGDGQGTGPEHLVHRALRRHPRLAHRRDRPLRADGRFRVLGRRPARRSGDGAGRARSSRGRGPAGGRGGGDPRDLRRRICRTACARSWRSVAGWRVSSPSCGATSRSGRAGPPLRLHGT